MTIALPLHRRKPQPQGQPVLSLVPEPSPVPASDFPSLLLVVDFRTAEGREWSAVGGGESVAEAVEVARRSLPAGHDWQLARWNQLYGD
jgi:hypothetical protein